jgi:hypothetical protein
MGMQMSPYDQQMAMQALMQGFMTEVDVIMQAYEDYDKHFLGILDKAEYHQRVKRIAVVSKVYIDMTLLKNDLERRLNEVDDRINTSFSTADADAWSKLRIGTYRLFMKSSDLLGQAEAQIAAFRSMSLVKAFEQFKSDVSQITGVPMSKFKKIQDKAEKREEDKKKGLSDKAKEIVAKAKGEKKEDSKNE